MPNSSLPPLPKVYIILRLFIGVVVSGHVATPTETLEVITGDNYLLQKSKCTSDRTNNYVYYIVNILYTYQQIMMLTSHVLRATST